jgi:hypothetical protein
LDAVDVGSPVPSSFVPKRRVVGNSIGILNVGGDSPGSTAAIQRIGKSLVRHDDPWMDIARSLGVGCGE